MLDFYIIEDDQATPNYPEEFGLQFVGGIDYGTFTNLQSKGIIDQRFDYYSDFRLNTVLVKQIQEKILQKELQADTDVIMLIQFFNIANEKESGLIAYGD
ncbi:hypothetical protein [Sphingobacterium detergens]|uniref:Uncharacterized protein n=1 Tax=Sphingobacterium detergens TaxID=1145106 RepID=A0A420B6J3_SPHD1|nr:hypothetical protein [Sphingobacterium detergens]RKE52406.1 hypothetical protein DFQ12_2642 [Sphingobacterium detergens]